MGLGSRLDMFVCLLWQSGTAFSPWAEVRDTEGNRKKAFQLGQNLGCESADSPALLSCLQTKDAEDILKLATDNVSEIHVARGSIGNWHLIINE